MSKAVAVVGMWMTVGLLVGSVWANGLQVTSVSSDQGAGTVTFTLEWFNSFRNDVSTPGDPANWDAAWVFIKWRLCTDAPDGAWTHGTLSDLLGDHTIPSSGDPSSLQATDAAGTPDAMDAAPNNTGLMLRRRNAGVYATPGPTTLTFRVTNLPAAGNAIDVRVIGIEMVYVLDDDFQIGEYASGANATWRFNLQTINSENAVTVGFNNGYPQNLSAGFPKGKSPFYLMKYEISQGQYADFLNTVSSVIASTRYLYAYGSYRNRLSDTGSAPFIYVADNPDRACNYFSWADLGAYLDWACLRPMTELEYEKACRGPGAVPGGLHYAWGNTTIVAATTLTATLPAENGQEYVGPFAPPAATNANAHYNYNYLGGSFAVDGTHGRYGPIRCGIFAKPTTTTRQDAGAGYYGNQELSGNVWEYVINAHATTVTDGAGTYNTANQFIRSAAANAFWGDGALTVAGNHDVTGWPSHLIGVINGARDPLGYRGGAWNTNATNLQVTYRDASVTPGNYNRNETVGGRGVR